MTDKTIEMPETVEVCPSCNGKGEYEQTYTAGCGRGYYQSMGACGQCATDDPWKGAGYVYKATGKPVGKSVLAQIETMNGARP